MYNNIYQAIVDSVIEEFDDDNISRDYEYIGICANIADENEDDIIVLIFIRIADGIVYLINNANIGYVKYKERGRNIDMLKNVFNDTDDIINSQNNKNIYGLLLQYNASVVFQPVDYEEIFEIDFDEEFFNNPEFQEMFENTKYIFDYDFIKNINLVLSINSRNKIEAKISFGIYEDNDEDSIEEI